ncbi:MAG: hypothetical protein LBC18_07820, partial [Opitutaceae bacterium]|nr:hypothetical protein [Opitutaceae bacterium]
VNLVLTYHTDVPVAVLVPEPVQTDSPRNLRAGQRFTGEYRLVNKGLIKAEQLAVPPVVENEWLRLEIGPFLRAVFKGQVKNESHF